MERILVPGSPFFRRVRRGSVGANLIQPSARLRIAARRDEGIVNFNELSASDLRDARNTPPTCSKWRMDTSALPTALLPGAPRLCCGLRLNCVP